MKLSHRMSTMFVLLASCATPPAGGGAGSDGLSAVDGGGSSADVGPDTCLPVTATHPWPAPPKSPAICSDSNLLQLPPGLTSNSKDGVSIEASGVMQPIGELEQITVQLLRKSGKLDTKASGELVVTASPSVEIVTKTAVSEGVSVVTLRVNAAGSHDLTAQLKDDPRAGTLKLHGYATKLPVWRLDVSDVDLKKLYKETVERLWIDGKLHVDGEVHVIRVRLHGGSSRAYPKKSLRLNLIGSTLKNGEDSAVLRAEWRDKSNMRLLLAAAVLKEIAGLPFPDLTPIQLRRTNGAYMGLMIWAERFSPQYLKKRGRDPGGDLYEADPPFELSVPGANLLPQPDVATYAKVYQHHGGVNGYEPLIELIEGTLQKSGKELQSAISSAVQLDALFAYLASMAAIQNHDHVKKNFYLYRDSDGPDCRWEMLAWDLDLTFGHLWSPQEALLGETIISNGDPLVGSNLGSLFYNQLVDKVLTYPPWLALYKAALSKVTASFDETFVSERTQQLLCTIGPDLLADRHKRATNAELSARIDELAAFAKARRTFLNVWVAK